MPLPALIRLALTLVLFGAVTGCRSLPRSGSPVARRGDEIIVAGRLFHTGTPVVTWLDPGGYDAYRVERRFAPPETADWKHTQAEPNAPDSPNRYGFRKDVLPADRAAAVREGGWDLPTLQGVVDQFVIHFDASGTSRQCFKVLHDVRGLSVHFLLDVDGTVYQTLDLKERAWHATSANSRAVGIEIASIGAVPVEQRKRLEAWYAPDPSGAPGTMRLTVPDWLSPTGIRTPGFVGHPARREPVIGNIQGESLIQYDFTPQQYSALVKLTATLCRVFPKIRCDYPRDASGSLVTHTLPDAELRTYHGLLGHYHIQKEKVDPGPAFQWDRVVSGARQELRRYW